MSKNNKDKRVNDVINEVIPKVEDNRQNKDSNNPITISNYKFLDAVADKDKIDKYIKEKQDALHNPFYSIDLNTSRVKQNEQVSFIVDVKKPKHNISKDDEIDNLLHNEYVRQMQHFNYELDKYLDKTYTSFKDLDDDIYSFNSLYDQDYYNGFNLRVRNYADKDIKRDYINKYANAVATLQLKEIQDVLYDILDIVNVDIDNTEILSIINKEWLKKIQELVKDNYSISADSLEGTLTTTSDKDKIKQFVEDFNKDDIDIFIFSIIKEMLIQEQTEILDASISKDKKYYKEINTLYKEINKKILDIVSNFNKYYSDLSKQNKKARAVKNIIPTNHTFNLVAPKIFNTTYKMGKYTTIDKDKNLDYDVRLNIVSDEIKDLRDIIFQEDITNKTLSLLPIDLALFIGFTDLSAVNGNNIPINMQDTLRYITESKNLKLKDNKKLLQLYEDRLRLFDKFKVKAIITNRETNKSIKFLDPISILENARVLDESNNQISYIIGRSAILVILNYLSEQNKTDYLTTFNIANSYINDTQSNTIYTLNMKYYLIIKILQMGNSKERLNKYNPKINLTQLYEQTALLKGVDKLSKSERARLRASINKYLDHLKGKGLLLDYDYNPTNTKQLTASDSKNAIVKKSDAKDSIYIKL